MATGPTNAKLLAPYLALADDSDAQGTLNSRKLAYYLRYYAVDRGVAALGSAACTAEDKAGLETMLGTVLEQVETAKAQLGINPAEQAADLEQVIKAGLAMFAAAYAVDKTGSATKDTAIQYRRAGLLFDIVRHFLLPNVDQKVENMGKYAKLRTVNIVKDLQAGRQPLPPDGPDMSSIDAELGALDSASGMSAGAGAAASYGAVPTAPMGGSFGYPGQGMPSSSPAAGYPAQSAAGASADITMGGMPGPAPAYGQGIQRTSTGSSQSGGYPAGGFGSAPSSSPPAGGGQFFGAQAPYGNGASYGTPGAGAGQGMMASLANIAGFGQQGQYGAGGAAPMPAPSPKPGSATETVLKDATELTKFALAALKERNAERAASFLAQALNTLAPGTVR